MMDITKAQIAHDNATDPRLEAEGEREQLIDYLYQVEEVREAAYRDAVQRIMEGEEIAGVSAAEAIADRITKEGSKAQAAILTIASGAAYAYKLRKAIRAAVCQDAEKELDEIASLYVIEHLDGQRDSEAVRNALES